MKIIDNRREKNTQLELGDLVKVEESYLYRVIGSETLETYYLMDEETNTIYRDKRFKNVSHIYHHLKKYYDEFSIIKNENITLTLS